MVRHAGICLVTDEGANGDAQTDASIEDGSLPLQFRMLRKIPRFFVVLSWDETCALEPPPQRLLRSWKKSARSTTSQEHLPLASGGGEYEFTLPLALCSLTDGARLCLSGVENGFVPGPDWNGVWMEALLDMFQHGCAAKFGIYRLPCG